MARIVKIRERDGPFESLADFVSRLDSRSISRSVFEALASVGALDCLHDNRAQLVEHAALILRGVAGEDEQHDKQCSLFGDAGHSALPAQLPPLPETAGWTDDERLQAELRALGVFLSGNPLDQHHDMLLTMGVARYTEFIGNTGLRMRGGRLAGVVLDLLEGKNRRGARFIRYVLLDQSARFEATDFQPIDRESKPRIGDRVIVSVRVDPRRDDTTLRIDDIELLSAAEKRASQFEMKRIDQVVIRLTAHCRLPLLKDALDHYVTKQGRTKLLLDMELDGTGPCAPGRVRVRLPGSFLAEREAIERIKAVPGVQEVSLDRISTVPGVQETILEQ